MTEKLLIFPSPSPPPLLWFQEFFVRGGERGERGSRLLNLFYSIYTEGIQCFFYTFSRGWGCPIFSRGGGGGGPNANFYRNPYIYNLLISRGPPISPPPSGSAHGQCGILARICCGLLLSLETPNANLSIVFKRLAKALIRLRICAGWSKPFRRMVENGFAPPPLPREFCRHILSCRELKAESFKRCLHSVLRGVSL